MLVAGPGPPTPPATVSMVPVDGVDAEAAEAPSPTITPTDAATAVTHAARRIAIRTWGTATKEVPRTAHSYSRRMDDTLLGETRNRAPWSLTQGEIVKHPA